MKTLNQKDEVTQLCFVFNDGPGGDKEGKADGNADIFVDLVDAGLAAIFEGAASCGRFCLVRTSAQGVFSEVTAAYQAAMVSVASAGRNTLKFGIARSIASCSIGSWVGPSSPTPILSWDRT